MRVVAAVIEQDGKIYAAERGYGEFKGGWEFPGGKVKTGETDQKALKREIEEELATEIEVVKYLGTVEYDYPHFHLTMACYLCHVKSGHLTLLEHMAAKWVNRDELDSVDWLPADREMVNRLNGCSEEVSAFRAFLEGDPMTEKQIAYIRKWGKTLNRRESKDATVPFHKKLRDLGID